MRFWEFGQIWSVLATVIVAVSAAAAAAASSDWQLASSDENLFDLNPADGKDWALGTDPFSEGGGDIASSSGIPSYLSSSDDVTFINVDENQQLFLNNNDPQTELLFADMDDLNAKGGEQCASSNLAGKFRRRSECGTTGIVTAGPTSTVGDVTLLDRLYCPTASIFIKSLFVCSSPDPLKTIPGPLAFWTLYESTRCKQYLLLKKNPFVLYLFTFCSLSRSILQTKKKKSLGEKTNQKMSFFSQPSLLQISNLTLYIYT